MSAWRVGSGILYLIDKNKLLGIASPPSANECFLNALNATFLSLPTKLLKFKYSSYSDLRLNAPRGLQKKLGEFWKIQEISSLMSTETLYFYQKMPEI